MKLLVLCGALAVAGCSVAPVIGDPGHGGRGGALYDSCRLASRDYCRYVIEAEDADMKRCVADRTYGCVMAPRK